MTIAELLEMKDKEIKDLEDDLEELDKQFCELSEKHIQTLKDKRQLMLDLKEAERRYDEMTQTANEWMSIATSLKGECVRLSKEREATYEHTEES